MRRGFAILLLVLGLAGALAAGCGRLTGKLTGVIKGNVPPHTLLFVSGALDTVNHIVHLYWFGTDPDGSVQGFEWQLKNPVTPADTAWHFTTRSDSLFTIQAPDGYTNPVFSVRAIDNAGARDPNPPVQDFQFSNQAPTVRFVQKPLPTDTTFASLSVTWNATDVDGDPSKLVFLVWLDGRAANPEITTASELTMPSDRFLVNGTLSTGPRKIFVQAIDDGGRGSAIDSAAWVVRRPVSGSRARLLIVDDGPNSDAGTNLRYDTLYSNSVARVGLPADQYAILRLDRTQPFRTAKDMEQTFKLFEAVVWYRGNRTNISSVLGTGEAGISEYLKANGKFFIEGLYLFRALGFAGVFSEDLVRDHLNSRLFVRWSTDVVDSVAGFGNTNPSLFIPRLDVGGGLVARDPIPFNGIHVVIPTDGGGGGLREFVTTDSTQVAMWAQPGTMSPANADRVPVGMTVAQPGGGRAVFVCTPIVVTPGNNAGAAAFVTNLYRHFGLDRP